MEEVSGINERHQGREVESRLSCHKLLKDFHKEQTYFNLMNKLMQGKGTAKVVRCWVRVRPQGHSLSFSAPFAAPAQEVTL